MLEALLQMAALIACGVVWRIAAPGGQSAAVTRGALTGLVFYLFLPALVLLVLWQAPLGVSSLRIALVAAAGILAAMLAVGFICRVCGMAPATRGAVMLAAAFPNATYLGLPVLEATFGKAGRSVAIQYDLFACTPLLLTLGIWIAARHGSHAQAQATPPQLHKVPAVWAAVAAILLNIAGAPMPEPVRTWLQLLANGVVPLMLISLGLSLQVTRAHLKALSSLVPALGVKLVLMPIVAWLVALAVGLQGMTLQAVVLEAAMPSMVLGMVLCDRYGLDSVVYAATVTLSTALSFFTLAGWAALLQIG